MNPLMGLGKSKGSTDVASSPIQKSKNKSQSRHVDRQPTSGHSSMISTSSGIRKTSVRSPQHIHETELASDSRGKRSEPKRFLIPQIIITHASTETVHTLSTEEEVQRTIKDQTDYGPYYRHRNPSTVDAYKKTQPDHPKHKPFI